MIMPYIDYCDIFFINSNANQIKKLQTLQDRALRICFNTGPKVPINMLHQSSQIPKLDIRRESHLLNFMYKNKNNTAILNTRNIRTRLHDAPVFNTIKPLCEKYKANVYYKGALMWNGLPVHIRNIEQCNSFKENRKKWALSKL